MDISIDSIKEHATYQVSQCETKIAELTEKVNGNFLYNFSWKIEALYKAHYLKREWSGILEAYIVNAGKEQEIIEHHKSYFSKQALSTNLSLKQNQIMINYLKLYSITYF